MVMSSSGRSSRGIGYGGGYYEPSHSFTIKGSFTTQLYEGDKRIPFPLKQKYLALDSDGKVHVFNATGQSLFVTIGSPQLIKPKKGVTYDNIFPLAGQQLDNGTGQTFIIHHCDYFVGIQPMTQDIENELVSLTELSECFNSLQNIELTYSENSTGDRISVTKKVNTTLGGGTRINWRSNIPCRIEVTVPGAQYYNKPLSVIEKPDYGRDVICWGNMNFNGSTLNFVTKPQSVYVLVNEVEFESGTTEHTFLEGYLVDAPVVPKRDLNIQGRWKTVNVGQSVMLCRSPNNSIDINNYTTITPVSDNLVKVVDAANAA